MAQPRQGTQQTFPLKLRRKKGNRLSLLKFHSETRYQDWRKIEMVREDNKQIHNAYLKEEKPEFGAGSVYRQKEREELRRARFETKRKEYREEDQPWMLKVTSDSEKLFKGVKEGGVRDNSDYFVFAQSQDGSIEVTQVEDWYNFQAYLRFKAMDAEEAEEEFNRRDRTLNYFSLKCKRKLRAEAEEQEAEEESRKNNKTSLKISELEEWISSEDDSSDEEKVDGEGDDDGSKKRKRAKNKTKSAIKKKKYDKHSEAMEESDDGDEEGKEREYISDSSDSEPEDTTLSSVAEEKGLKKLLTENQESSDSSDSSSDERSDAEGDDKENEDPEQVEEKKTAKKGTKNNVFDEFSSSDDESEVPAKKEAKSIKNVKRKAVRMESKPEESDVKMKVLNTVLSKIHGKKSGPNVPPCGQLPVTSEVSKSDLGPVAKKSNIASIITQEDVCKYLRRKPITMKDLLMKFISKGFHRDQVSSHVGDMMQKLQPERKFINGKYYFSLDH